MDSFWNWYGSKTYYLRRHIKSVKCFFVGHDIKWGCHENYEPDYCDYCWKCNPYDMLIFRDYMTRAFVWFIDLFPEKIGDKILSWKPPFVKRMPDWWEY